MGKAFGLVLMVVTVWIVAEVTTKGMDHAFGGAFASGDAPADSGPRMSTPQRAGAAVERAQQDYEARYDELLPE